MLHKRCLQLLFLGSTLALGQTQIDLRTQSKSIDFSGANATKPFKSGVLLPSSCGAGEMFFKTDAPPGANLYGCTALNSWTLQSPAGGSLSLGGDLSGAASAAVVTQVQGHAVSSAMPLAGQLLVWNGAAARWEPQTAPSGNSTLGGDLSGQTATAVVTQVQGHAVSSAMPLAGQSLMWNGPGAKWEPQTAPGGSTTLGGDLSGQTGTAVVTHVQGHPVSSATPLAGQSLMWNGSNLQWEPQTAPGGGSTTLGGDLSGQIGAAVVTQIQGRPVATTAPANSQVLTWNGPSNRWEPQPGGGGGGGATMASQLGDFAVTRANATTLNIGSNCAASTPCNVRFGSVTYSFTGGASVTLTGGPGAAFIYVDKLGALTVGHNLTLTCNSGCIAIAGVTSFPADSIPLFFWNANYNSWDTLGTDDRSSMATKDILAGVGITTTETQGHTSVAVDPAVVGVRTTVPPSSSSNCASGTWAADNSFYYLCVSSNYWLRAGLTSW